MLCLGTNTTNAQIADGLYHCRYVVLHTWDDFVIVQRDTAYVQGLSEIKSNIHTGLFDTLVKQHDSLYTGKKHFLIKEKNAVYLIQRTRKDKRNISTKLTYADAEITQMWDSRHNKLLWNNNYEPYIQKLQGLENNKPAADELFKAYYALERRAYELNQPAFAKELQAFKQKYLQ